MQVFDKCPPLRIVYRLIPSYGKQHYVIEVRTGRAGVFHSEEWSEIASFETLEEAKRELDKALNASKSLPVKI